MAQTIGNIYGGGGSYEPRIVANEEAISLVSNPNLLINGDMTIWQRGDTQVPISDGGFSADRWRTNYTSGAGNVNHRRWLPNLGGAWGGTSTAIEMSWTGDANIFVYQAIENGIDYTWGKTVTLSFDVLCQNLALMNGMFADLYSVDGVIDTTEVQLQPQIDSTTDFVRVSATWTLPESIHSGTGIHLQPRIFIQGLNGLFTWITNVKFEIGPEATPFVSDDPVTNLMKCQRYYEVGDMRTAAPSTTTTISCSLVETASYKVTKRDYPNLSAALLASNGVATTGGSLGSGISPWDNSNDRICLYMTTIPGYNGTAQWAVTWVADAEL